LTAIYVLCVIKDLISNAVQDFTENRLHRIDVFRKFVKHYRRKVIVLETAIEQVVIELNL
jgi:hypothetical protein